MKKRAKTSAEDKAQGIEKGESMKKEVARDSVTQELSSKAVAENHKEDDEGKARPLATLDFLVSDERLPSTMVFESMSSNPLLAEVIGRKKLSYREMALIANTVIGGLDNEIIRLKQFEQSFFQTLGSALNRPLIAPAVTHAVVSGKLSKDGEGSPDPAEVHWFVRYLTLRNILGALTVAITLSAGFFAWFNKDYRSLLDAKNERVTEANQRVDEAKAKVAELEKSLAVKTSEFDGQGTEIGRLRGELTKFESLNKALQSKVDTAFAVKAAAAGTDAQIIAEKEKTIGELTTKIAALEGKIATADSDSRQWKSRYDESQKTINERNAEVKDGHEKLADAKLQRDNAVNAWNEILGYLYEKDKWGEIKVSTDMVKQKLRNLESKTSKVDGMKSVLQ